MPDVEAEPIIALIPVEFPLERLTQLTTNKNRDVTKQKLVVLGCLSP
jgi:hypothetical protein